MADKLLKLFELMAAAFKTLGIEAVLPPDTEVPQALAERFLGKLTELAKADRRFNDLSGRLVSIGSGLMKPEETTLSLDQILDRLPRRLELATAGETYIADLQKEALRAFDTANVDPQKKELSAEQKEIRGVIASCDTIPQLQAYGVMYGGQADARFGSRRTSIDVPLPGEAAEGERLTGLDLDISESAARIWPGKGGDK